MSFSREGEGGGVVAQPSGKSPAPAEPRRNPAPRLVDYCDREVKLRAAAMPKRMTAVPGFFFQLFAFQYDTQSDSRASAGEVV